MRAMVVLPMPGGRRRCSREQSGLRQRVHQRARDVICPATSQNAGDDISWQNLVSHVRTLLKGPPRIKTA